MQPDLYTKAVLTVIAVALSAIVAQNATSPARALNGNCGGAFNACYVQFPPLNPPLAVRIER